MTSVAEVMAGKPVSRALAEKQNAGRFGIEAMNVLEELEVARPGPIVSGRDGGHQGGLEVPARALPGNRHQHPAGRFVDREN